MRDRSAIRARDHAIRALSGDRYIFMIEYNKYIIGIHKVFI